MNLPCVSIHLFHDVNIVQKNKHSTICLNDFEYLLEGRRNPNRYKMSFLFYIHVSYYI